MVKLGSLCIVVYLVVGNVHCKSRQTVAIDKLEFSLFETLSDDSQNKIYAALETAQNFFARKETEVGAELIASGGGLLAAFVPGAGAGIAAAILAFLPILVAILSEETDWKKNFVHALKNREDFNNAQNDLKLIKNILNNKFSIRLNQLKSTNENKAYYVRHMDIDLSEILGFFSNGDSPLRNLPELGAPVLLALTPIIANFLRLLKQEDSKYMANTYVPCILENNLQEYYRLTLMSRLNKIEVFSTLDHLDEENTYIMTQSRLSARAPSAFRMRYISDLPCQLLSDNEEYDYFKNFAIHTRPFATWDQSGIELAYERKNLGNYTIIKDILGKKYIAIYDQSGQCANAYFDVVQNRLLSEFQKAYNVAHRQCKESRLAQRKTTEYIWLSIHFGALYLKSPYVQGTLRPIDEGNTWDPYMILLFDDRNYTSNTYAGETFGWTYLNERIRIKIKKTSTLRFKLFDDDSHQNARFGDDPLLDETYTIDDLPTRISTRPNQNYYLYLDFVKMDDYVYDFELI